MNRRTQRPLQHAITVLAILLLAAPPALSTSWWGRRDTREGLLAMVRNRVILFPTEGAAKPAELNDAFAVDDRIKTQADSSCRILFMEDSFLTLGPLTDYTLTRSRYDEITGARDVGFRLASGKLRLTVGRLFGRGSASVETPTAVVGVKGTDVIVGYDPERKSTLVMVLEGLVDITSLNAALAGVVTTVSAGEYAEVDAGPEAPASQPAPESLIEENVEDTSVEPDPERSAPEVTTAEANTTPEPPPPPGDQGATDLALIEVAEETGDVSGGGSSPDSSQDGSGGGGTPLPDPLPDILPEPVLSVPPDQCPGNCP